MYPISLPVKSYLKPYIESLYGNPTVFSTKTYFGMVLMGLLERPSRVQHRKEIIEHRVFDKFDTPLLIHFSDHQENIAINEHNIIAFNKLFEERFEEDLCRHCEYALIYHEELKKSLEKFCWKHHIEIDVHITYEALKKKEYRFRTAAKKKLPVEIFNCFLSSSIVPSKISA